MYRRGADTRACYQRGAPSIVAWLRGPRLALQGRCRYAGRAGSSIRDPLCHLRAWDWRHGRSGTRCNVHSGGSLGL